VGGCRVRVGSEHEEWREEEEDDDGRKTTTNYIYLVPKRRTVAGLRLTCKEFRSSAKDSAKEFNFYLHHPPLLLVLLFTSSTSFIPQE
jgi:hypothetical protein